MNEKEIEIIEDKIGHVFKDKELLIQAFTRRSYAMENGGEHNEVLEFIGDKVLDFVVVKLLAEKYGHFTKQIQNGTKWWHIEKTGTYACELDEGELTEIKKRLVQKATLAEAIYKLDLENFLIMGEGDIKNDVQESASVKEDLFEAILGAVTLDSKWDLFAMQECVKMMLNLEEVMESDEINYLAKVQNWSLYRNGTFPFYKFEATSQQATWYIPKDSRLIYGEAKEDTLYSCELQLPEIEKHFLGYGPSKCKARKNAAQLAYEYLEANDLLYSIKDEIDDPSRDMAINQLEILARRNYFSVPTYEFQESHDEDGNPIWKCKCCIEEEDTSFETVSSVKKEAKKDAAWEMLKYVLNIEEN